MPTLTLGTLSCCGRYKRLSFIFSDDHFFMYSFLFCMANGDDRKKDDIAMLSHSRQSVGSDLEEEREREIGRERANEMHNGNRKPLTFNINTCHTPLRQLHSCNISCTHRHPIRQFLSTTISFIIPIDCVCQPDTHFA